MRRATFPVYATISGNLGVLRKSYSDIFSVTLLIGTPITLGLGLVAEPLVTVMLGEKWGNAIPLLQILSLYALLGMTSVSNGPVYLALARPYYLTCTKVAATLLIVPTMIFGIQHAGIVGAAWALTGVTALLVIVDLAIVMRLLRLPIGQLISGSWRPLVAAGFMAFAVTEVQSLWPAPTIMNDWTWMLVISITVGATVYPATVLLLWWFTGCKNGAEKNILTLSRKGANKIRAFRHLRGT